MTAQRRGSRREFHPLRIPLWSASGRARPRLTSITRGVSSISAAREVLWGNICFLTTEAEANAAIRYARYAHPRLAVPGGIAVAASAAAVWGLWSLLPAAVAVGFGVTAGIAVSDVISPWICRDRSAWGKARRASETVSPATSDSAQVMFGVWRSELDRQRHHLTGLADRFAGGEQPWQTATTANLQAAAEWLNHADTALADTAKGMR